VEKLAERYIDDQQLSQEKMEKEGWVTGHSDAFEGKKGNKIFPALSKVKMSDKPHYIPGDDNA